MQLGVKVVGHLSPPKELKYTLEGGLDVTFHTAFGELGFKKPTTFFSPLNVWPGVTAAALDIEYVFMRNATPAEAALCAKDKGLKIIDSELIQ